MGSAFFALNAQMSGTVTINSGATATSSNFKDWYSFWRSLQGLSRSDSGPPLSAGISASVIVDVITDHTETAMVEFPAITGTGSGKTITIKGNNRYLYFNGPNEVISFKGGDHITITGLTIRNTGSSAARNTCIRFSNNSDSNRISNCTLEFSNFSGSANNGSAYIAFSANDTVLNAATSTLTGSYNTINNNLCRTTNSGNPGPAWGFAVCGSTSGYTNTAHNNTFSNNTIENFYRAAVLNIYSNGNQFYNNNISRANSSQNNCSSALFGFICSNTYGQSRSTILRKNNIHDLPYSGCTPSNGVNTFVGFHITSNTGTSARPFVLDSNNLSKLAIYDNPKAGIFRVNSYAQVNANNIEYMECFSATSEIFIWEFRDGNELSFAFNKMTSSKLVSKVTHYLYTDSITSTTSGYADILNNYIAGNDFSGECYILIPNQGNYRISGNYMTGNKVTGNNGGYFNGIVSQSMENIIVSNNLIANNLGHDGFVGIYLVAFNSGSNSCKVWQNTVYSDGDKAPVGSSNYDNNGIYLLPYFHTDIEMVGNIIQVLNSGGGVIGGVECSDTASLSAWDDNTYHVYNYSWENWPTPLGWMSSFSDYIASGLMGPGENFLDPKFTSPSTNDFHSNKWQTQNNVLTSNLNLKDITGANRPKPYSDRGAYEYFSDLKAVKSGLSLDDTVCSGTVVYPDITVKNLFKDTAYNFFVSYTLNGAAKVSQKVTTKLLQNDSVKITFTTPLKLNAWGKNRVAIFIDAGDDNPANDTFIFNTVVLESPGGGKLLPSAKNTKAIYKTGSVPDVTIVGQPVIYDMSAPRKYSNSGYNTNWSGSVWAVTVPGNTSVTGTTYTPPSGSTDQEIKFLTSNSNLEDSLIKVCIKITDLNNGCDTTTCRNVFIQPVAKADFSYSSLICGNDTAKFTNLSSVKSGGMSYHWDFGTGNPADTSNAADPWFKYAAPGSYKVKLTVYTIPNGFATSDSATITVKVKPVASFSKTNPCLGENAVFTNTTTPSNATYTWYFGDGNTSTATSPTHKYANAGNYQVKLFANLGGCIDSTKSQVQTFAKPVADFTYTSPTPCDNAAYTFQVKGPFTWGTHASYWDFGGGNTSSQATPSHIFGSGGTHKVKLLLVTSFGCKDSTEKTLTLKEAPKVAYLHTEACSIDSTVFTNTTPAVTGAIANYKWYFGDGGTSTAKNTWHKWLSTGTRQVKLVVTLDNGCRDSIAKTLTVRTQPLSSFTDNSPVCSGSKVIFKNNTTWAMGSISYHWNFADGDTSLLSDPEHTFTVTGSTTYNVTLCSEVDSFCRRCYTKPVVVNAIPSTCDFVSEPDYAFGFHGMKLTPKNAATGIVGIQSGVIYKWTIQNGGTTTIPVFQNDFPNDGTFNVTMCAEMSSTGCSCCVTKAVTMDRASYQSSIRKDISLYPNPNKGAFTLELPLGTTSGVLSIRDMTGKTVHIQSYDSPLVQIRTGLAPGVYILYCGQEAELPSIRFEITD